MAEVTLLTTSHIAERYGVATSTVRKWVAEGKLHPTIATPGGHYRFTEADVEAMTKRAAEAATA